MGNGCLCSTQIDACERERINTCSVKNNDNKFEFFDDDIKSNFDDNSIDLDEIQYFVEYIEMFYQFWSIYYKKLIQNKDLYDTFTKLFHKVLLSINSNVPILICYDFLDELPELLRCLLDLKSIYYNIELNKMKSVGDKIDLTFCDNIQDNDDDNFFVGTNYDDSGDALLPLHSNSNLYKSYSLSRKSDVKSSLNTKINEIWYEKILVTLDSEEINIDDSFLFILKGFEYAINEMDKDKIFDLDLRYSLRLIFDILYMLCNNKPLNDIMDRQQIIYENDIYMYLIHYNEYIQYGIYFWNKYYINLDKPSQQQLSMYIYSNIITKLSKNTVNILKRNKNSLKFGLTLLNQMNIIIKYFESNNFDDLIKYLTNLSKFHSKLKIPKHIFNYIPNLINDAFLNKFGNNIYDLSTQNGIKFIFCFVVEIMIADYNE